MSIIIDIGDNSTEKNMIDLIANMKDGQCPHSTTIRTDLWKMERRGVEVINLGNLSHNRYLNNTPARWMRYRAQSDLVGSDHPTKSDRNPGCGITNGSDGKIIIIPHLITIHLTSTMGCNFTELSDPIGSDCRIRSDSNTMDSLVIPQPVSYEFHRIPTELPSVSYRIR